MRALLVLAAGTATLGVLVFAVLQVTSAPDFPAVVLDPSRELPQGDVLRAPVPEPGSINPFTSQDAVSFRYILPYTHDPLIDRNPADGTIRPCAAASWESSEDGRTLTFRLRDDLVFADGTPVSEADLAFTLSVARDPRLAPTSDFSALMRTLVDAGAPDRHTIVLEQREPLMAGFAKFGTELRIMSRRHFLEAAAAIDPRAGDPASDEFFTALAQIERPGPGTGPYQIATSEAQQGESHLLDLIPNPWSWRRAAQPRAWNLAGIRLEFVTDAAAILVGVRRQEFDWGASSTRSTAELLREDPGLAEHYAPHDYQPRHGGPYVVLWNCDNPKLSSPKVRRALSMLFDRQGMVDRLFGGNAEITRSFFPPNTPEHSGVPDWPRFDPDSARAILADEGVTDLEIELLVASGPAALGEVANHASSTFRAGGVTLKIATLDWNAIRDRVDGADFDAALEVHQYAAIPDPYERYHSTTTTTNLSDPRMDHVVERLRVVADPDQRRQLAEEFGNLERELQPMSLLFRNRVQLLLHKRFQDASPGPLGIWIENWWVAPGERMVEPELLPVGTR